MEIYFGFLGIISFAYFIVILIFNGLSPFLWFWPLLSMIHFMLFFLTRMLKSRRQKKQQLPVAGAVFAYTSYALGMLVLMLTLLMVYSSATAATERNLDYVIVLGTELKDNRITRSLEARLDRAIEYHEENKSTVFVLSGGHGRYSSSTEAGVMYFYMLQHGVPARKLLMEFYSNSTQEKVGYSIQTILADRRESLSDARRYSKGRGIGDNAGAPLGADDAISVEERPLRIGILSSEYNLFRALSMAERFGVEHAYPIATETDRLMQLHYSVREAVAILKDRLVGNI